MAVSAGLPPLQVIFSDPEHKEWTRLDLQLAKAYKLYDRFMGASAFPPWIDRSERVEFEVKKFISKSDAALTRAQDADMDKDGHSVAPKGTKYYAVPKTKDGKPLPTLREWLDEKDKIQKNREGENPNIALKRPLDPFGNPQ